LLTSQLGVESEVPESQFCREDFL